MFCAVLCWHVVFARSGCRVSVRLHPTHSHAFNLHVLAVYPDASPGDADDWVVIEEGGCNRLGSCGDIIGTYNDNCKNIHDSLIDNL